MNAEPNHRALCTPLAVIFFCACSLAFAEKDPPPEIPIQQWLQGPDHVDFDWKVVLEPPTLTFQQRHLQTVQTTFTVGKLLKAGVSLSDLHFVVKFADADGKWFPGQCYSHFEPPPGLAAGDQIHSYASAYLRPGRYRVAVMAFDSLHRRGNLSRSSFEIPAVKDDPLPEMDRDLPQADLLPNDPWAFGQGTLRLPVDSDAPVQLDVVTDFPPILVVPHRPDYWHAALLLRISEVLSQLKLKNGCVRFGAIDVRGLKTYVQFEDAEKVDWANLRKTLEQIEHDSKINLSTVDVRTLAAPNPAPDRFARFLEQALSGAGSCNSERQPLRHVMLVVSDAFPFFHDTETVSVRPEALSFAGIYHFELDQTVGGVRSDQMESLLKSLHPMQFRLKNATKFREALAHVISDIEKTSRAVPASTTH